MANLPALVCCGKYQSSCTALGCENGSHWRTSGPHFGLMESVWRLKHAHEWRIGGHFVGFLFVLAQVVALLQPCAALCVKACLLLSLMSLSCCYLSLSLSLSTNTGLTGSQSKVLTNVKWPFQYYTILLDNYY